MTPSTEPVPVRWSGDHAVEVGTERFRLLAQPGGGDRSTLLLFKTRPMVETYVRLADRHRHANIVELGVLDGGSTAFVHQAFTPAALLAIDLVPNVPEPLAAYLARTDDPGSLHVHPGVDQADAPRLADLVSTTFTGPLDLVIDDASHLLRPTIASFESLFPLLRPGGHHIIEDWSRIVQFGRTFIEQPVLIAALYRAEPGAIADTERQLPAMWGALAERHPAAAAAMARRAPADEVAVTLGVDPHDVPDLTETVGVDPHNDLVPLVEHLLECAAARPDVVASLQVMDGLTIVERGPAPLDPETFDLLGLAPTQLAARIASYGASPG